MKKSIYSLVLSDILVEEIDKIAYLNNTSRSNVINKILAEHLSYSTPEQKMSDIFDNLRYLINSNDKFRIVEQPSESMFSIKSALKYKYKPTIKYSVELFRNSNSVVGELKISFRTQNSAFIQLLNYFFLLWSKLEDKYISEYFPNKRINRRIEDGRYVRTLILPLEKKFQTNEYIGKTIGEYINIFDSILKEFFNYAPNIDTASKIAEKMYISYLNKGIIII